MLFQPYFDHAATEAERQWLTEKLAASVPARLTAFVAAPRYVARRPLPALPLWTMDRLARVLLLISVANEPEPAAKQAIDTLFDTAELQELVALYTALPWLPAPEEWLFRATEAVRSNMGPVFEAIAFDNPYPAQYFAEPAWNQLVLKCIFTDKPIDRIVGLTDRANQTLANNLSDFAHERWAAGRTVPPEVWQLIPRFMTKTLLADVKKLLKSTRMPDREAARAVCQQTTYLPARQLLGKPDSPAKPPL